MQPNSDTNENMPMVFDPADASSNQYVDAGPPQLAAVASVPSQSASEQADVESMPSEEAHDGGAAPAPPD